MLSFFKIVTINHKKLDTEDLEHFVVKFDNDETLSNSLKALAQQFRQEEVLYLNTCNRVIFLFYGKEAMNASSKIDLFKMVNPDIERFVDRNLKKVIELKSGREAIDHIFEVASSIDSLVIGEREIFRQFRTAYERCRVLGLCGDNIRLVEKCTVKAAKDVYTNTAIGKRPVSVVSLVIQHFLKRRLSKSARILLLGAGETNTNVSKYLVKKGYNNIVVFNRTLDNAVRLSEQLGVEALHLDELQVYDRGFDCIFACTNSQTPLLDNKIFDSIVKDGSRKVIVDLAIPRNISHELAEDQQVDYISIDSIRAEAENNLKFRATHISDAREILSRHLEEFTLMYERRQVEKALSELPSEIKTIKERAINEVYRNQIDHLPDGTKALIFEIADYMERKCVAIPMKLAKQSIK